MISPKNNCAKCNKIKNELEEKTKENETLKKNILLLKSQLFETSNLISYYIQLKKENEKLNEENKELKEKNEEIGDNYQFQILKEKHLKLQKKYKELEIIYNQANSLLEQFQKNSSEGNKTNENKLKRELSEKEKLINYQKLIISQLKDKTNLIINENGNFQNLNNNNNEYEKDNDLKINELFKEKEFLDNECQKYKEKYIMYKSKYKEFKKNTSFFLKFLNFSVNTNNHQIEDLDKIIGNKREREEIKFNNKKNDFDNISNIISNNISNINYNNNKIRKISVDSNNLDSEVFDKKNFIDFELSNFKEEKSIIIDNKKEENNKKKRKNEKKIKEESIGVKTRKMEKNEKNNKEKIDNKSLNLNEENDKNKIVKNKNEIKEEKIEEIKKKKKGRKSKKEKEKEEEEKKEKKKEIKENLKEETEKNKIDDEKNETKEKKKEINIETVHINPIPKPKRIINEKPENIKETLLKYIRNNSENNLTKEFILEKFDKIYSISESINFIFETIIPNIKIIDLSNMLLLIEIFIEYYIEKDNNNIQKIIANFLENINLIINNLFKNNNKFIVSKEYKNFNVNFLKENSVSFSFINFSLFILIQFSNDLSEISKFLLKLAFNNNNCLNKICSFLQKNISNFNDKVFINEKELLLYKSEKNINSFYFIQNFKTRIVSERIFNLIINIYSNEKIKEEETQNLFLINIKEIFNSIDNKIIISNEENKKFNLSQNISFLELYQIFLLMVNLLKLDWIYLNIFEEIFWSNFTEEKQNSFKRICDIYYSSLLLNLILKKEGKNSIQEKNIQNKNQHIGQLFCWLSSIYNPDQEYFDLISVFERISALSWLIESPIFNKLDNPLKSVINVIKDIYNNYSSDVFPNDFMDIVKLNKYLINK